MRTRRKKLLGIVENAMGNVGAVSGAWAAGLPVFVNEAMGAAIA